MTDTTHQPIGLARTLRTIAIVTGVVSLIAGVVILVWPLKSAVAITVLIAIYTLVAGVINIALAISSKGLGGWLRVGISLLGILFVVSSIVAFANLTSTTVLLAAFVAIMLGVSWIVDGIVSLFALGGPKDPFSPVPRSKGWTIAFAIISILAGVVVILSPLLTAVWLWLFIGAALVVFGIIQVVRAATLER
ncbi:HdeD family acid-resistance protein [Microbacterium sp. NPDC055683]